MFAEVEALPQIRSATGLAKIKVSDGHVLTDLFTARMFSELLDIPQEQAELIYQAYGIQHEQYQVLFGNREAYSVPLVDMLLYLFDMIDHGVVSL